MNEHKPFHFSQKGWYLSLIACAAVIGIAGFIFQKNVTIRPGAAADTAAVIPAAARPVTAAEAPTQSVVEVMASLPIEPEGQNVSDTQAQSVHQGIRTASPVDGSSIADYAMEVLSYNETTRDWRTHDGIDLAAPEGTPVTAAAAGTVQAVYDDDTMGTTVVVHHGAGYVTRYSCLSADTKVAVGDYVDLGQQLGQVGESAILENAVGTHVHFSVTHNDKSMDPNDFLALE